MGRRGATIWVCAGFVLALASLTQAQSAVSAVVPQVDDSITVSAPPHAGTKVLWGRAVGIVHAPLAEVAQVVEDYGRYYAFLPHFRTSRVLSQRGSSAIVYMEAVVAMNTMKLWAQMRMGAVPGQGTTRVIEARMMEGNLNILEARWELTPIDAEHTSVAFQLLIDPKVPLPASLLSHENAKASRKTISALRSTLAARRMARAQR